MAQEERREAGAGRSAEGEAVTAGDIMTREVLTTRPNVPVRELAKQLAYHRISGMPVVDDQERILGVVSEADIISKRRDRGRHHDQPVISVTEAATAKEVAVLLTEERIKRVPVVRDGKLVGLIGRSNVVSWVGSQGKDSSGASVLSAGSAERLSHHCDLSRTLVARARTLSGAEH